jgi:hypothetical protein
MLLEAFTPAVTHLAVNVADANINEFLEVPDIVVRNVHRLAIHQIYLLVENRELHKHGNPNVEISVTLGHIVTGRVNLVAELRDRFVVDVLGTVFAKIYIELFLDGVKSRGHGTVERFDIVTNPS